MKKLLLFFLLIFQFAHGKTLTWSEFQKITHNEPLTLVYAVSEAMPLSKEGLKGIKILAKANKIKLLVVNDPLNPLLNSKFPLIEASENFIKLGFFHHYPSISLFKKSRICGSLVPGFKEGPTLKELFSLLKSQCNTAISISPLNSLTKKALEAEIIELKKIRIPRKIGYYSRPVNDVFQSYYTGDKTYLFDTLNLKEIPFQGAFDLIASPDARFLTLPTRLRFFNAQSIFENPSNALNISPIYQDDEMSDQYQSIGILEANTYRVITAWSLEVAYKDFSFNETENTITPIGNKTLLCPNLKASTPILSKDGTMIGGYLFGPEGTHTTHIIKVNTLDKTCQSVLDLGTRTSKVDFSYDNKFVTYIATNESQKVNLGAYITRIEDGATWEFAGMKENEGISFPSFKPNGNVLLLRTIKTGNVEDNFFEEYTLNLNEEATHENF